MGNTLSWSKNTNTGTQQEMWAILIPIYLRGAEDTHSIFWTNCNLFMFWGHCCSNKHSSKCIWGCCMVLISMLCNIMYHPECPLYHGSSIFFIKLPTDMWFTHQHTQVCKRASLSNRYVQHSCYVHMLCLDCTGVFYILSNITGIPLDLGGQQLPVNKWKLDII